MQRDVTSNNMHSEVDSLPPGSRPTVTGNTTDIRRPTPDPDRTGSETASVSVKRRVGPKVTSTV